MRKIRLSDTDLELFDIEIGPTDYLFYQRHKDAFKTMWREQGKPFWTRFQITFRSYTVKHGIIKQMNIDSPKFQNILDQAFIFIHEHFADGKESTAKNFIDDVARLAQNQDKFPALDSKSFSKDPFFTRDTRELFRKFFGPPDQKSSYLKVYILCPVFLRFGGSVCRCLIRWMDASTMDDPNDDSYWVPPQPVLSDKSREDTIETTMCTNCVDDCGTRYFHEKIMGNQKGPISMRFWILGDPRFNDPENPLFAAHLNPADDWREHLSVDMFRDFYNYAKFNYGTTDDKCNECQRLKKKRDKFIHVCKAKKKKQVSKEKEELIKDLKDVRTRIDQLDGDEICEDYEAKIQDLIQDKPRVRHAIAEAERQEKLEKKYADELKAEEENKEAFNKNKCASPEPKKARKKGLDENRNVNLNENNKNDKATKSENKTDEQNCKEENATKDSEAENSEKDSELDLNVNIYDFLINNSLKAKVIAIEYDSNESLCETSLRHTVSSKATGPKETSLMDSVTVSSNGFNRKSSSSEASSINWLKISREMNCSAETDQMDGSNETDQQDSSNEINKKIVSRLTCQLDGANEIGQVDCFDENVAKETENDGTDEAKDTTDHEDIPDASENRSSIDEASKQEFIKHSFMSDKDLAPNKNIVAGFKVIKIEDQENGFFEVNVSAACLKSDDEEDSYANAMMEKLKSKELNNFRLSVKLLREKIHDLPQRLEWWEGRGFAVAVLNYEEEEKAYTKKWTQFTLKINGYEEIAIKQTLIQLLKYVTKRKRRICYGWTMEVDDVVACILPEESRDVEDLSISISRGFRFEDRLTDDEKASMLKHHPNLNLDLVLTGVAKGGIAKTLEKKIGRERLRKVFDTLVADRKVFAKDLPYIDVGSLCKKLNKTELTRADILWEQMIRKPESFEFFVLYDREKVLAETDWWKLGLTTMDIRGYNETRNPCQKLCPICKTAGMDCSCETAIVIEPKAIKFVESSNFKKFKVLGDEDCPGLPKMNYTETNISMDKSETTKHKKATKSSKSSKKKEKRIELSELPAKFIEAGINADVTTVTIPLGDEEPMMGKVPIPVFDKLEKLAPVPGVHNSLNFTFQNGKSEQTITVTLGAYMPEDKINEIEEKKGLIKLIEEEEKRKNAGAIGRTEKTDKKDGKKNKSKVKSPQKMTIVREADAGSPTKVEMAADLTTKFLQEIFADDQRMATVTKSIHQHMGLSNKSQMEKKARKAEKAQAAAHQPCTCPHHDQIQKIKEQERMLEFEKKKVKQVKKIASEKKEKLNDFCEEMMDLIDNKKTSRKFKEISVPKVAPVEEVQDNASGESEKPATKRRKSGKGKRKENGRVTKRQDGHAEVEGSVADKIPDEELHGADVVAGSNNVVNGPGRRGTVGKDDSSDEKEMITGLRTCGSCGKVEPVRKAFKKCQKCKDEGVLEVRYYCGRDCQVNDWKEKHKLEHVNGLLG